MQEFKDRLKELREERGLSMKELGKQIGVSDAAVCKWENGIAEPKVSYVLRLADYFECSTDFLLGRNDDYAISTEKKSDVYGYFKTKSPKLVENAVADYQIFPTADEFFNYDAEEEKTENKVK